MRMKYKILHESTQEKLEQAVNDWIGEGWTPQGPAQVTVVKTEMQQILTDDMATVNRASDTDLAWSQTMVGTFPEPGDREVENVTQFRIRKPQVGDKLKARGFSGIGEVLTVEDQAGYFKVKFDNGTQFIHFTRIEEYVE